MNLNIGSITLPINAATKSFAILGKRGSGKSYNAAVIAEEFAHAGIPFVVLDPIDIWFGIRLSADGKHKGLPVVVFGLQHADIQITREDGARIAQAIVRDNISCVISTFGMPKAAQRQLIKEFAEELLRINNTPRHVFIEEAHEFVPQRVFGAMGQVFAAVEALVVMGRNKGIGVTMLNQRAATINKDVLTQVDTLIAFRNVAPQDRKALSEWVEHFGLDDKDFKTFMQSLPSLPTGEGWIWSPEWLGIFERVKFRKRTTFHPDREKMEKFVVPELEASDVQDFISRFNGSKTNEKASKAARPSGSTLAHVPVPSHDAKPDIETAVRQAEQRVRNEYESHLIQKDALIRQLQTRIDNAIRALGLPEAHAAVSGPITDPRIMSSNAMLEKLGGMPRKVYETLLQHPHGLTKRQIALMCGYAVTSGSFSNAISKLSTMGLIKKDGDVFMALTR